MSAAEILEFQRGERDGRDDGAAGVKPLSLTILERRYSSSYREGYHQGYKKATESRQGARV